MAGDWFPLQYWRSRCPEIVRVSSATARTRHEVLGIVCDFWSWLSTESEDGSVRGVYLSNLPDLVGADAAFWEQLQAVGWVKENPTGISVPSWDSWLSESAKKRAKDAKRKAKSRAQDGRFSSAKCPRRVRKTSRSRADKNVTTEQDSTGHIRDVPNGTSSAADDARTTTTLPAAIDTPEVRAAWADWLACRKAKRKPVSDRAAAAQLAGLATLTPAQAVACITASIANDWQGLFPEKYREDTNPPRRGYQTRTEELFDQLSDLDEP